MGLWNVGVEKPLSVHSLLRYHEDLDAIAKSSVGEGGLTCEVSEFLEDSVCTI